MDLEKEIEKLKQEVEKLKTRRVGQSEVLNSAIKMRHIGEGIKFIQSGLVADLPAVNIPMQGTQIFYAYDSKKFYAYNKVNSEWDEVQLA
jgi:hypothetical protein